MTKYCKSRGLREWMLGKNICDGNSSICKHIVKFGNQEYCGFCPPRCSLHQIVKHQAGCLFCRHYIKDLDSSKCYICLSSETRINLLEVYE